VSFDDQAWNRKEMGKYLIRDADVEENVTFEDKEAYGK
jgi:hypothetical protein